jgi:hypothetical protein
MIITKTNTLIQKTVRLLIFQISIFSETAWRILTKHGRDVEMKVPYNRSTFRSGLMKYMATRGVLLFWLVDFHKCSPKISTKDQYVNFIEHLAQWPLEMSHRKVLRSNIRDTLQKETTLLDWEKGANSLKGCPDE